MARQDRRSREALDEAYRYYRELEKDDAYPELYRLVRAILTVSAALTLPQDSHFKITKQLWRRIQQSLFDRLLRCFPGYAMVMDEDGEHLVPKTPFPEEGVVQFNPDGCRRADDIFTMDIAHLFPATRRRLAQAWEHKGARLTAEDFQTLSEIQSNSYVQAAILGDQLLSEEASLGHERAYNDWWDLYQQAFCTNNDFEKQKLQKRMSELESVWGDLYY